MFRDITTLLKDPVGLSTTVNELCNRYTTQGIDKVVAIEARGFIIDLPHLGGRKRLEQQGYAVHTLVEFEGE